MKLRWLLSGLFCLGWFAGITEIKSQGIDIASWKKQLRAKEDPFLEHLLAMHQALYHADSSQRCNTFQTLHALAKKENTRFNIRMALLQSYQPYPCPWEHSSRELLEQALDAAYELEDEELIVAAHRFLSHDYNKHGDGGFSLMHLILALEQMERYGFQRFNTVAAVYYGLGDKYYRQRDYRNAVDANLKALRYQPSTDQTRGDTLSTYWQMNAWNAVGLGYEKLVMYDSAMLAFTNALNLAQDSFWRGLIKGNQGDVFFLQGKYDEAEPLLQIDFEESLKFGDWYNANITLQRLARIANARGDSDKALAMLHEAALLDRKESVIDNRASLCLSYALVFRNLGQPDSVYHYMMKYKLTHDTVEMNAAEHKLSLAQLRLTNQKQINEIDDLRKDKKRIQLIRNFSIALILILAWLGYVYVNRMRLKARLRQQEALEGKQKAEMEAAHAHSQLTIFTESLREKTRLLEEMQIRATTQEQHQVQIEQLEALSQYTILTEADWDRFKQLFVKVYPGFFIELKQRVPDITLAEQRMAALIKLRIPNKDAASMLGISPNSIHKTRQRLRTRMGFTSDTELDRFFNVVED